MISFGFNSMRRIGMHRTVLWTCRMLQIMMRQLSHNFIPVTFLQPPDNLQPVKLAFRRVLAVEKQCHTAWCGGSAYEHHVHLQRTLQPPKNRALIIFSSQDLRM